MGTFYISVILVMRFFQSYFSKKNSIYYPETFVGRSKVIALSNGISAFFGLILFFVTSKGDALSLTGFALAFFSGISLVFATVLGALSMRSGTMVLSSVCGTAGMLVPCVAGIFLFDEPVSLPVFILIFVVLAGCYLLCSGSKDVYPQFSVKTALILLGVFLSNGITMTCQKALTYINPDDSVTLFSLFSFLIPFVIFGIASFFNKFEKAPEKVDKRILLPTFFLAVAVFIINQFATSATVYVPSALLFGLINGGATVITAIVSAIFFGEKPTVKTYLGLSLSVGALVLIKMI